MTREEIRLNLLEQVVDRLMTIIAMSGTPDQLDMLQKLNDNWTKELTKSD